MQSKEASSTTANDSSEDDLPSPTKKKCRGLVNQFFSTFTISISFLICGNAIGWTSPVLYKMEKYGEPLNLTTGEASFMVSLFYVGNFVMPIPSGLLSSMIGRKMSMAVLSVLPLSSWALAYFAFHPSILHTARFLIGLWAGAVFTIAPIYVGEISEPKYRGGLSAVITVLMNVGVLMSFFIAPRLDYWTLAIVFGSFPVVFLILFFFVPESPAWLMRNGKYDKAWKMMSWLRAGNANGEIRKELEALQGRVNHTPPRSFRVMIRSKGTQKALIIVAVASMLQRFSGVSAIAGFVSITLPDIKIGKITTHDIFGFIATAWAISILVNPFLVDRVGRKPLLIISSSGVAGSTFLSAIYFFVNRNSSELAHPWMIFVLYAIYGILFNIGLGPVVTTLQGEMLPPDVKAIASGFTAMILAAASSLTTAVYLPVALKWGLYVNFLFYTAATTVAAFFSWLYVVETAGKTLNEIQIELHRRDTVAKGMKSTGETTPQDQ